MPQYMGKTVEQSLENNSPMCGINAGREQISGGEPDWTEILNSNNIVI